MSNGLTRREFFTTTASFASSFVFIKDTSLTKVDYLDDWNLLTRNDITSRIRAINETYTVGELLSDEDAAFILKYGNRYGQVQKSPMQSFAAATGQDGRLKISGSKYGNTIRGTGTLFYHENGFWKSYGSDATIKVTSGTTPKSMKLTVSCVTYGMVGESSIAQTYNGSVSASCKNKKTFYCNPQEQFHAFALTYSVSAKLSVTTASGNVFTLLAD